MSTEVIVAPPKQAVKMTGQVHPTDIDVSVSGDKPDEIAQGHAALTEWCERKVAVEKAEHAELVEAHQRAVKIKWKPGPLKSAADRAAGRVRYYEKMLAAFRAGFVLVPNFPLTIFAIRTKKEGPNGGISFTRFERFEQKTDKSPVGQGDYVNPIPKTIYEDTNTVKNPDGSTKQVTNYYPDTENGFDEIEFPMAMAKPHIMDLVDRAMALKIFDEIGILPESRRASGDPVIAGVIKMPKAGYSERTCTFLIAWHVDTRTL